MAIPQCIIVNTKFVMAASISQTRYDYKITLQEAIKEGKIVHVAFEKCPLCCENRAALTCDACVNQGAFTHTQRRDGPRFRSKREEWHRKKREREIFIRSFELEIEDIERANNKRTDIESARQKNKLLRKAIENIKTECEEGKTKFLKDRRARRAARATLETNKSVTMPNLKQKILNLSEPLSQRLPTLQDLCDIEFNKDCDVTQLIPLASKNSQVQQRDSKDSKDGTSIDPKSVPILKLELDLYYRYLAKKRAAFVNVLSQRIFPIEEVFALSESDNLVMSMATALKDACETAFIGGRWVHSDHRGENHCKIVGSILPDYSGETCARSLFQMSRRHASENPDKIPVGNPSYGILSAIGYTAMFTNIAAHVLDIHLPRRCSFKELKDDMSEADFCNFVWRLHQNIIHLGYSQEVHSSQFWNNLSLQNLMALLRCPELGRTGGFSADYQVPVEAELCPLEYESEDDTGASAADMDLSRDWERVPAGLPTYDVPNMGVSSPIDNASTAGALFNAAAASLSGWFTSYYGKK